MLRNDVNNCEKLNLTHRFSITLFDTVQLNIGFILGQDKLKLPPPTKRG